MPPKRTRGGTVKASSSRGAAANDDSSATGTVTTQPAASDDTPNAPFSTVQASAADPDTPASTAAPSPAARGGARKNLTPRTTIRRSKEVRDANIRAEAAKEAERERAEAAQEAEKRRVAERMERLRRGWSSNDQRGRGRGGYMGDRRQQTGAAAAVSGPLSQGVAEGKVKQYVPHRKEGATKSEHAKRATTRVKDEEATSARSARKRLVVLDEDDDVAEESAGIKKEGVDGGYVSSDDDEEAFGGPRKDVDHINLVSDEEEDGVKRERAFSLVPVRLRRVEHKDRNVGLNTEPSFSTAQNDKEQGIVVEDDGETEQASTAGRTKTKSRAKDLEVVQTTRRWRGVYDDDDEEVAVKDEPMEDVQVTSAAPPAVTAGSSAGPRYSPEQTRRVAKDKAKASGKASFLAKKKPTFSTEEEEHEWKRWQQDLQTLVEELGHVDVDTETGQMADSSGVRPKSEAIYLFQFPPVLPNLIPASEGVKEERDDATAVPSSPQQTKRTTAAKPKPTSDSTVIKDESPGAEIPAAPAGPKLSSGMMGKLRVHQSGKVTLDWGGTSLQLNMGLDASFLQDAVITELPASDNQGDDQGKAYALGPVRGKFVVTPDWDAVI